MKNPKISIIVAMDKNRGIGRDNGLLWHIPEELKRFREITTGHPIIMGRKTYESIGHPLPNRTNIVITRSATYKRSHLLRLEGCIVVDSLEKAIKAAKEKSTTGLTSTTSTTGTKTRDTHDTFDTHELFIIGGGQIYKKAMESDLVDKLYVTQVSGEFQPTVFFPEYASQFTKKVFEKEIEAEGTRDGIKTAFHVKFLELEKK